MDAVVVLSPEGNSMIVSEVILEGDPPESWFATPTGPTPGPAYRSLNEALRRNNRSVTTANRITVADAAAAKAMLGKSPA